MADILDLPEVRARMVRLSVESYERLVELGMMDRRVELIRGILLQKLPKSPLHVFLTQRFHEHFYRRLPAGFLVGMYWPLRLEDSEPEPDVVIVRGEERDYDKAHPTTAALVVEVAVSSAALDRENASLYAEAGVPEYWIVLGEERQIEVYRQPENGVYQQKRVYAAGETLVCESVPGLRAPVEDWFA